VVGVSADAVSPSWQISGPDRKIPFPKGVNMPAAAVRILVVGNSIVSTESTLKGLARSGWESHAVKTVREADAVLRTIRFQLTLATEKLPDGTGYDLSTLIAQQSGNLFISVPLSETCLWLPAVENGVRSLGQRSLNPLTLATEAELILRATDTAVVRHENYRKDRAVAAGEDLSDPALPARAPADLTGAQRCGREAGGKNGAGQDAMARRTIASRRRATLPPGASSEDTARFVAEDALPDLGALAKRWRGVYGLAR
jgi:hypothetical protein